METAQARTPTRMLRLLLCGLGVAGGLVLLGLAFGSHSASADEPGTSSPPPAVSTSSSSGSGLLGAAGSVLGTVTAPVQQAVNAVTSTVSDVATPVTQALPAPVQQVVQPAANTVTQLAQSVSMTQTLAPVTGAVDQVVGSVPVVGSTLNSTLGSVASATAPVTATVDTTVGDLGAVTGGVAAPTAPGIGPGLPSPVITGGSAPGTHPAAGVLADPVVTEAGNGGVPAASGNLMAAEFASPSSVVPTDRATAGGSGAAVPASPAGNAGGRSLPPVNSVSGMTGTASGGGAAGGAVFGAVPESMLPGMSGAWFGPSPGDDRLPLTPTYETDSTPD